MSGQSEFQAVGENVEQIDASTLKNTGATDAEGHPVQELESLCMNCHEQGTTRLLMTKIPFFKEVVIMSFACPHCGFKNAEIQSAGEIQIKGSKYTLQIEKKEDLNRQVIKSEYAMCKFAELDIEIPPQRGQLTTVEGLLSQVKGDLEADQQLRKEQAPQQYEQLQLFLGKVQQAIDGDMLPLTLTVDDPTGNSYVEYIPNEPSHKWSHVEYFRTRLQNLELGIAQPELEGKRHGDTRRQVLDTSRNESQVERIHNEESEIENLNTEVQTFNGSCPSCQGECETHMKQVEIPHFKEVIIMNTSCEHCGYKSNEVKTGGAVPEKGRRVTLKIDAEDDLARDILKSESCRLLIPELNLDLTPGTLGGRFTTVEGLLAQVYEELESRVFAEQHDSMAEETINNWKEFFEKLQRAIKGDMEFTIVMEDPLAASYIQNAFAPDPDPNMIVEDYERTEEQNEDLGLNDMVV